MFDIERYKDQLLRLHDHICPRQVLGLRMGELAGELLGLPIPQTDKSLFVFIETDGCFSDGVMVATGCSAGHRSMRLEDQGKVAATFVDTRHGAQHGVRIWPHPLSRQRAAEYVTTAQDSWHCQLNAYQRMPSQMLLCSVWVELAAPVQAIMSKSGLRATCAVCGEEIINEREVVRNGVCFCHACAGISRYYLPASESRQ